MDRVDFAFALFVAVLLAAGITVWRAAVCAAGWRAWVCYQIGRVHAVLLTRCSATNACTYPEHGPAIIVANHTSPVDPQLLWFRHFAQFRKPRMRVIGFLMAREYYFQRGFVGWVSRAMESIPVNRSGQDAAAMREALRRLEAGHLLGVFPEGRINLSSPDEQLLPGGTGVAWLAMKSRAPILPVFIRNAPRSASIVRSFITRTRTTLTYGEPINLAFPEGGKVDHERLAEVADLIMMQLARLGGIQHSQPANPTP